MTIVQLEIQLVAVLVAAACALPGTFLVLRRMAMMSDAISHAILPGIVIGFFITHDLSSPLLLVLAALTGVLTVSLVELLNRTRLVKEDAAIGIVFPMLFSLGVILIARYAGDVHLDADAVLLGELAFAPFDRLLVGGADVGPRAAWVMGGVLLLTGTFIALFYKELKLSAFDAGLAAALGLAPTVLHYILMGFVSLTAVAAFDAVGSILVVALMIGPPAAAHLLTDRLPRMMALSIGIAAASAIGGYWLAHALDASIAGSMATMVGLLFGGAVLFAPNRGLIAAARRRRRHRQVFAQKMLTVHLLHHEGTADEAEESRLDHLHAHLRWRPEVARRVARQAEADGLLRTQDGRLRLTDAGRRFAEESVLRG